MSCNEGAWRAMTRCEAYWRECAPGPRVKDWEDLIQLLFRHDASQNRLRRDRKRHPVRLHEPLDRLPGASDGSDALSEERRHERQLQPRDVLARKDLQHRRAPRHHLLCRRRVVWVFVEKAEESVCVCGTRHVSIAEFAAHKFSLHSLNMGRHAKC
jgi:hypothetical protein